MNAMTINSTSNLATRPARQATQPMRLTRRGKAVVLLAAIAAIAILAVTFGQSSMASNGSGTPAETTSVRIMPGHTLWDIASKANPNGDIRRTVDEIIELNSMPNASALQVGTEIAVPVYS